MLCNYYAVSMEFEILGKNKKKKNVVLFSTCGS